MAFPQSAKTLTIGLVVSAMLVAVGLDYFTYDSLQSSPRSNYNTGKNGIWLRYLWYAGKHEDAEYTQMYDMLRDKQMRYAYFHVLKSKSDGRLELHKPEIAKKITTALHSKAQSTRPIAWVYIGSAEVNLDKPEVRKNLVAEFLWLINECGFEGVQVDYEFAPCGAQGLLRLLEETRQALPKEKLLSVATPMWYPGILWGWSDDYLKQVARRCDQLAVMSYDSFLYLPRAYVWLVKQQAIHITADCAGANPKCKVILGLPTYNNQTLAHHPHSESLKNAICGVVSGLGDKDAKVSTFEGIALFADYTTDESEWKQYEEYWSSRSTDNAHGSR